MFGLFLGFEPSPNLLHLLLLLFRKLVFDVSLMLILLKKGLMG
jgi:hypothetical protein